MKYQLSSELPKHVRRLRSYAMTRECFTLLYTLAAGMYVAEKLHKQIVKWRYIDDKIIVNDN